MIGKLATKYDAIVMEDLAYFAMDFRKDLSTPFHPPYQATVARYTDNYMLLISGSKAFSYAGERIGVTCISDALFHRHFEDLSARYQGLPFGPVFSTRMLYALSSGLLTEVILPLTRRLQHGSHSILGTMTRTRTQGIEHTCGEDWAKGQSLITC